MPATLLCSRKSFAHAADAGKSFLNYIVIKNYLPICICSVLIYRKYNCFSSFVLHSPSNENVAGKSFWIVVTTRNWKLTDYIFIFTFIEIHTPFTFHIHAAVGADAAMFQIKFCLEISDGLLVDSTISFIYTRGYSCANLANWYHISHEGRCLGRYMQLSQFV